ncbi:hypothetical protein [uncultured Azohydromonas sp.]|jgi:hypothetical protein|uniref:hypothetical protein n=1 Tax=uncultured Azohydromonas sp. TaxID=487342 RepID=UPI0026031F91|nr:hypothetical protein [uncultured Azohydromonas sp.]
MTITQILAAAVLLALAGCAATTPEWDARFGDTVRQARVQQLVDPAAGARAPRPEGLDGKAAAATQRDYADYVDYVERAPRPEARTRVNPR